MGTGGMCDDLIFSYFRKLLRRNFPRRYKFFSHFRVQINEDISHCHIFAGFKEMQHSRSEYIKRLRGLKHFAPASKVFAYFPDSSSRIPWKTARATRILEVAFGSSPLHFTWQACSSPPLHPFSCGGLRRRTQSFSVAWPVSMASFLCCRKW